MPGLNSSIRNKRVQWILPKRLSSIKIKMRNCRNNCLPNPQQYLNYFRKSFISNLSYKIIYILNLLLLRRNPKII